MLSNDFKSQLEKETLKKVEGMHGLDAITTLQAQLMSLRKQLGSLNVSAIQLQPQIYNFCEGGQSSGDCQVGSTFAHARNEQASFINNFQCSNNSYSNPAWGNHPNITWGDNFQQQQQSQEKKVNLMKPLQSS